MNHRIRRLERKWTYNNVDNLMLHNALLRSKFFFSVHHPKRKINSLYFDDLNYSSINENLDGISQKKKYRIRWYGSKNKFNNPIFEIKIRKNFEVYKRLFNLKKLNNLFIFKYENLDFIKEFLNNQYRFNKTIYPILTTHYDREYFISNNGLVRATLDYNLQSVLVKENKDLKINKNYYSNTVLEIKYDVNLDQHVRDNLKSINTRLSRNSKFVNSAITTPSSLS
jgi:SPX domain protein involved in polyphosphate accumulation|tara:strand:+ start:35 stop:709 length:675 start_codon:yes stop_codon:yes gene_type:complete